VDMRIARDRKVYAFAPDMVPVAEVDPGSTVVFETSDCYDGQVPLDAEPLTDEHRDHTRGNPATGPVFVRGASPGQTLVAQIERIEVAPAGLLFGDDRARTRREGRRISVVDGVAELPGGLRVPIDPVVGVIGVAPVSDPIPNTTPGDHGGNLDTPDVKVGTSVYLPVAVEGGLFGLGDIHALQGDGEVCGQGIEIAGEVTVRLEVLAERLAPCPVIRTPQHWAIVASALDLDEAVELALLRGRDFLMARAGVDDWEAIMLLSTLADVRISQIVNPLRTVRVCIPDFVVPG